MCSEDFTLRRFHSKEDMLKGESAPRVKSLRDVVKIEVVRTTKSVGWFLVANSEPIASNCDETMP